MKNQKSLFLLILALFFACEEPPKEREKINSKLEFNPDQGIIIFEEMPTDDIREKLLKVISPNIQWDSVEVKQCEACDTYMELWKGKDIGTGVHAKVVSAGSGTSSRVVFEDYGAIAFLNVESSLPPDPSKPVSRTDTIPPKSSLPNNDPEKTVVIAVIDTGIDLEGTFHYETQLWTNPHLDKDDTNKPCHYRGLHGWNFIDDDENIQDDHVYQGNKIYHGTKVSQLIVSQVDGSSINNIEIMTLKTHDKDGGADLFSNICAIHYAMDHGAHVINASWGFYDKKWFHQDSYLIELITGKIADKGILFVTAAGNEMEEVQLNSTGINSRDLDLSNFIPAVYGDRKNNIIVATTTYKEQVSPSQNFSSKYVDYGVHADYNDFTFKPWRTANEGDRISGSSYATAILSGKIGATVPVSAIQSGISKDEIITMISPSVSLQLDSEHKIHKGYFIHSNIE